MELSEKIPQNNEKKQRIRLSGLAGFTVFLGLTAFLGLAGFLSPGPLLARTIFDEENTSIRIGVAVNEPPYSYVDSNGMIKGFNVDLARAVGIEIGLDVELYAQNAAGLSNNLLNHGLDALISNEKDSRFLSSQGIIESQDSIFVKTENQYITDLEGFWNSPVAINTQSLTTTITSYLDKYNGGSPKIVSEQEHGFLLLLNDEVDSYIGNKVAGIYLIQKWNQENDIKSVGEPFNISTYAFMTNASDRALLARLNEGLEAVRNNRSYEKIYEKWFGESAVSYERKIRQYFFLVGGTALITVLVILLAIKWRTALKKEVERRTLELNWANEALVRQQDSLKDKDQFKEDILNSVSTGIITVNRASEVTAVNARAKQALALDTAVAAAEADLILEGPRQEFLSFVDREKLREVLRYGVFYTDLEKEVLVGGEEKLFVYQIYPLRNRQGEAVGAIINFVDNSKERRLEEEICKADKMKSLDLMVSEFVHEIRTPLTSIMTMAELLPVKFDNPNFRQNMVDIVTMEVRRLDGMVTTLSEYAKPKQNNTKAFLIKDVLDSVVLLLQRKINKKEIRLELDYEPELLVYGDNMQLMQVFINLLLNAVESLPEKGVIGIKTAGCGNGTARVVIADNGPGIPEEQLKKVLEPFYTTRRKGTGLGLFICCNLLEKNRGALEILSRENQGTEVRVSLVRRIAE
ncbi:MAG: transporter substrate-binding domain-containing protein [Peptococcaceae bacterium]|nr:transporter substrate-binding domain-containing protein [Peptococcaceae bacterium]